MLRWLVRLLIFGAIAGAAAFAVTRLRSSDDEWDDFDDDEAFEFQETPVEIEVPASDGAGASEGDTSGGGEVTLQSVSGIGSAYEARLKAVNINSVADLAQANPESLNEQLDVPGGVETLQDWISQAKSLLSEASTAAGDGATAV